MATAKKNTALYWVLFFLSVILFFVLLEYQGEMVTLSLPFVCTFFAKAMDIM
ncbi:MAG TPA: hypothetical protein PK339_00915 [Flavitalea sp.]|nr:hypothetical protein [Flavitalea sp.]